MHLELSLLLDGTRREDIHDRAIRKTTFVIAHQTHIRPSLGSFTALLESLPLPR